MPSQWLCLLFAMLLSAPLSAVQASSKLRVPSASHDMYRQPRLMSNEKTRVRVSPFYVHLTDTPHRLVASEYDDLYGIIQGILDEYIGEKTEHHLAYVVFTNIEGDFQNSSTTLTLGEGVMAWDIPPYSGYEPSEEEVNQWVREAIDNKLADSLLETDYYTVFKATYMSTDASDSLTKSQLEDEELLRGTAVGSDDTNVSLIVAVAVAGLVAFAVVALFVKRKQRRSATSRAYPVVEVNATGGNGLQLEEIPVEMGSDKVEATEAHSNVVTSTRGGVPVSQSAALPIASGMGIGRASSDFDARSESSWTVGTEPGDSAALKSVSAGLSLSNVLRTGSSSTAASVVPSVVTAESFEQDRQVNLRKDMLTSAWSGRLPSQLGHQQDSVLQPSHFSASQERRLRQHQSEGNVNASVPSSFSWPRYTMTPSSSTQEDFPSVAFSSSEENNATPFFFRPQDGEGGEIFIMPGSPPSPPIDPSEADYQRGSGLT